MVDQSEELYICQLYMHGVWRYLSTPRGNVARSYRKRKNAYEGSIKDLTNMKESYMRIWGYRPHRYKRVIILAPL